MATTLNLEPPSTTVLDDKSAHPEAKSSPKPNSTVLYMLHQGLTKALPKNPLRKLKQTSAPTEGAEGKPASSPTPTKTEDVKEEDKIIQIQSPASLNSKKSTDHSCLPLKNIHVFKRKQASPKGQGLVLHGFLSLLLKGKQASPSKEPEEKLPSTSENVEKKPSSSSEQEKQKPSSSTTEEQEQGQHKPPSSEEELTNSTKTKNRSWLNILKGKQTCSSKGLEEKLPPSKEEKLPATSEEDVIQTQPPKPSKSTKSIPGCFSGKNWKQALSSKKFEKKLPSSEEETIQRTASSSEPAPTVDDKQKEPQNLPSSSSTIEGQDQQKPPSSSEEEQQKLPSSTTEDKGTPSSTSEEVPSNSNKTTEPSNSTKPPSGDDKHPALQ